MKLFIPASFTLAICTTAVANESLPVVSVTADFRAIEAIKSASSISVINEITISRRDAKHIDQILNTAPNVNFSAGASRGRFLQIRGIGERSQFKDPLDSSVGMTIDGIDYSGLGLASVLFDTQQVEILRGPQGTRYGSSAMAGAINIQSNQPTANFAGLLAAGFGNYNSYHSGLMLNGALSETASGRISLFQNRSDGFIKNSFLNKDNTNNIDEQAIKAQMTWRSSDNLLFSLTAHYLNADNGYNAFDLDNSRQIPADEPGHDRQETSAIALKSNWSGHSAFELEAQLSAEFSDLEYGFDWDWTNPLSSLSNNSYAYNGKENNRRDRDAQALDVRAISKPGSELLGGDWVIGLYAATRDVSLRYSDSYEDSWVGGPWLGSFSSDFETERQAIYGQLSWSLNDAFSLTTGLRLEHYDNHYTDSASVNTKQQDNLWGGNISLAYEGFENSLLYVSVGRGYKIGGVNGQAVGKVLEDPNTPASVADFLLARANFDAETLINYELGFKGSYLNQTLDLGITAFYMDRDQMQANAWVLFPPSEWKSYIDNVNSGHNAGLEIEARWKAGDIITFFASAGFLDTELGQLIVKDVDTDVLLNQSGRDQAHAPNYQFNAGVTISLNEHLSYSVEVDGKDSFYFSNSHNDQSGSYELINMTLSYEKDNLNLNLWGRNLTNEDYQTRGFYFDNGAGSQGHYQLGEPRVFGVSSTYSF